MILLYWDAYNGSDLLLGCSQVLCLCHKHLPDLSCLHILLIKATNTLWVIIFLEDLESPRVSFSSGNQTSTVRDCTTHYKRFMQYIPSYLLRQLRQLDAISTPSKDIPQTTTHRVYLVSRPFLHEHEWPFQHTIYMDQAPISPSLSLSHPTLLDEILNGLPHFGRSHGAVFENIALSTATAYDPSDKD